MPGNSAIYEIEGFYNNLFDFDHLFKMGNYASKLFYTNESRKESNEHQAVIQQAVKDNTCTPILSEKSILGDPRSVSAGITRTPIEVKCIPVEITKEALSAIPKYLQKKQYLETDMDVVMPPLTPKKRFIPKSTDSDQQFELDVQNYLTPNVNIAKSSKVITPIDKERFIILGLDPRSPAADFDRTPILMPKSLALIKARSQENLSRRGSYEMDVYNLKNCQEIGTSLSIPEVQLSDIASESLKTLDTEKEDELPSTSQYDSSISKSEEEVTVIETPKCMNEKKEWNKQKIAIGNEEEKSEDEIEKQDDCKNIKSNTKIKDDYEIELSHDSLLLKENVSGKEDKKELPREKASGEDIIIMFDEYTTISTSLPKPTKERDCRKKGDVEGKRKKDTKTDVKSILNEKKVFIPENKQRTEVRENRTPLGNRSNNDQMQKRSQLLRTKAASTRTQQENTPPYKMYAKTRNGTQWDPNSTVFI